MSDSRNTLVGFEPTSSRISGLEIHEGIHAQLQVAELYVLIIKIEGNRRHVFVKFTDFSFTQDILTMTNGTGVYKHESGGYPRFALK